MKNTTSLLSVRKVLSYPHPRDEEIERRVKEITQLGVFYIVPAGDISIGNFQILGKGCTSIVVLTVSKYGKAALKIQRTDSNRESCDHEAKILKTANKIGIGPRLFSHTDNLLLMEFLDGKKISKWLSEKILEGRQKVLARVLRQVLEDCYKLDLAGIDHGQLNPAKKHIIVKDNGYSTILDFESASTNRRVANVTSVSQYLFLGSEIAEKTCTILGSNRDIIIDSLKEYKRNISRESFEGILRNCRIIH
ncbi:MAG: serine/threonine protein kinase [Candidatus Bathyarchaeota archaeon]|nr:MAG: serine/threonine protein kinase [Candidatus Bathyarchaeota archaeon]